MTLTSPIDPHFRVEVLARTEKPQTLCWQGMHQDYAENFVADEVPPSESAAGDIVVRRLLAGNRGHYGPLEAPAISFNVGWFPHTVIQQARTHRIGCSWDVQSGRYTSQRILDVISGKRSVEEVFYLRQPGSYTNRQGARYTYTEDARHRDLARCLGAAAHYTNQIKDGLSEEHARELIPYAIRQHFVVSFNLRSLMHFLDMRAKRDAQLEITQLCDLVYPYFRTWAPAVAEWYSQNRFAKARLAP
jgi:thymidylate synthase (FAD)